MTISPIFISKKIKEYRATQGLSQSEFGKLLGVTAQAVCKWENELCYPDIILLPALAELMSCQIDDFFQKSPPKDTA
ncbi:MAG: helix-turn-helix domain-containing protein [Clostridia bacterium]|nr:helix-turn-helix domain-containing protein [Clostridia bacterium]